MTDVKVLTNPYQRGTGAMFTSGLGETVLVFAYPTSFHRVFTTWFCPSLLRILCFDDNGALSCDRVVRSWRLISLPKTRLVLEVDPDLLCDSIIEDIARLGVDSWIGQYVSSQEFQSVGGTPVEDPYGKLIFELVRNALMELRGIKEFGKNIPQRFKIFRSGAADRFSARRPLLWTFKELCRTASPLRRWNYRQTCCSWLWIKTNGRKFWRRLLPGRHGNWMLLVSAAGPP